MSSPRYKRTPEMLEKIDAMRKQGMLLKDIAEITGIHQATLSDWLAKLRRKEDKPSLHLPPVPKDTRGLTERTFGDPIFERSALYKRAPKNG